MLSKLILSVLCFIVLTGLIGTINATDTTNLETVTVTATTSDGVLMTLPGNFVSYARLQPATDSISYGDYVTDLTSTQVCQALKQHPPRGDCSSSNYPASPGIPSASGAIWEGNGCGAGLISTAFASILLDYAYGSLYSGDLNKPIKGNFY